MLLVHRMSAYLRSSVTSWFEIIVSDFDIGITSHNRNIFIKGKEVDCHPSPVFHLLRSICCQPSAVIHLSHPSISGCDPY